MTKTAFASTALKKTLLTVLTVLTLISLASGCAPQASTPVQASAPAAAEETLPTAVTSAEEQVPEATLALPGAADARQTVQDFLTAVQLDANSAIATQLLTPSLQQQAAQGILQAALLKTSEPIPSFEVSAAQLNNDGQAAEVEASLFTQKPLNLTFALVTADGMWKINEINLLSVEDYPATPEEVVQAFLIAYMERPDSMSGYLTAERRGHQPPGGSVGMLQILGPLEGMLVKSAVVNPAEPPQAAIVVMIKSGSIDSQRQFILQKVDNRWGIDEIMTVQ